LAGDYWERFCYEKTNVTYRIYDFEGSTRDIHIEDALQIDLDWGGTANDNLWRCTGRGEIKGKGFGGFPNSATNPNGKILLSTSGGSVATTNLAFTIVLEVVKAN